MYSVVYMEKCGAQYKLEGLLMSVMLLIRFLLVVNESRHPDWILAG